MASVSVGVVLGVLVALCVSLGVGIIVGHFAIPQKGGEDADTKDLGDCTAGCEADERPEDVPIVREYLEECLARSCEAVTCEPPYPNYYTAYHLHDETITVDGVLDDPAWENTPRYNNFINIYGPQFGGPSWETYAMMRYDDEYLYVGAYFEEPHIWANITENNGLVWHDNCFEVFLDVDLSTHWYKEFQINAIETKWDLMLDKPYLNGGEAKPWEMPNGEFKVFVEGTVNDPSDTDEYWTIELRLPFSNIVENNTNDVVPPRDKDQWRIQLSRVQHETEVVDGEYWKTDAPATFWLMQPQYAYNIHIPERWGFIQFSEDQVGDTEYQRFSSWNEYSTAIDTYNALQKYKALTGHYQDDISLLDLNPMSVSERCVHKPEVSVNDEEFTIKVQPTDSSHDTVTIRDDRYITYE